MSRNNHHSSLLASIQQLRPAFVAAQNQPVQSPRFSHLYNLTRQVCDRSTASGSETTAYIGNQLRRILEGALENAIRFGEHDIRRFNRSLSELEAQAVRENRFQDATRASKDAVLCFLDFGPTGSARGLTPSMAPTVLELRTQLEYYGLSIDTVDSIDSLVSVVTTVQRAVIIVDFQTLRSSPRTIERLRSLGQTHRDVAKIVVVSEVDSFEARLLAVRVGCDAFSSLPVDMSTFLSQLDALSSPEGNAPQHVLIVDDSPTEIADMALSLQQGGMVTSVVSEPNHVFGVLIEQKPDLIVMSAELVGCTGAELAAVIRQQEAFVAVPILFIADPSDSPTSVQAITEGGEDLLHKPLDGERLLQSVASRLSRSRHSRFLTERDSLTRLLNHRNLTEGLATEIQRAQRIGTYVSFAMLDLDHFKTVNDGYGHLMGDRVLRSLARLLESELRRTDTVGRYGGEEFGVIFFNTDALDAAATMNRIRDIFSRMTHQVADAEFSVSFSCGVASFPEYSTAVSLIAAADRALYAAKQSGRNRVIPA